MSGEALDVRTASSNKSLSGSALVCKNITMESAGARASYLQREAIRALDAEQREFMRSFTAFEISMRKVIYNYFQRVKTWMLLMGLYNSLQTNELAMQIFMDNLRLCTKNWVSPERFKQQAWSVALNYGILYRTKCYILELKESGPAVRCDWLDLDWIMDAVFCMYDSGLSYGEMSVMLGYNENNGKRDLFNGIEYMYFHHGKHKRIRAGFRENYEKWLLSRKARGIDVKKFHVFEI